MIKNKKILITGINGFLGTNLAKKLQNDGLKDIYVSKDSLIGIFLHIRINLDVTN